MGTAYLLGGSSTFLKCLVKLKKHWSFLEEGSYQFLPSATKLRRLCFYRRLVCPQGGGGVCLSADPTWQQTPPWEQTPPWSRPPPGSRHPPGADTPKSRHPPISRHPPAADIPLGSRHPSGSRHPPAADTPPEQTPPRTRHPPGTRHPPEMATAADGTHPTGMYSCFQCRSATATHQNLNSIQIVFANVKCYIAEF